MRKMVLILLILMCLCTFAAADELAGVMEQNERIVGSIDTAAGFQLLIDMPIPKPLPQSIMQYKLGWLPLSQKEAEALFDGKVQPAQTGEKWEMQTGEKIEHKQFLYKEDSSKYAFPVLPWHSIPLDNDPDNPILHQINTTAKDIVDALNINYEYPFRTVCNVSLGIDASLRPEHIDSMHVYEELRRADEYGYTYDQKQHYFDDEYYCVIVRLLAGDIPFSVFDVKSPSYSQDTATFDMGVYIRFLFNSRGEIVFAESSNLNMITKEAPDSRPILPWQECIKNLASNQNAFYGMDQAKLISAELTYSINSSGVTYPVWEFIVELHQPSATFPADYIVWPIYVDAHTGNCL